MISFIKRMLGSNNKTDFRQLYKEGAIIVDVRMPGEYNGGHIKGSVNVPLPNLGREIPHLKNLGKPVITCCLSGTRSAMARKIMTKYGIEAYNGGSWQSLQSRIR